MIEITDHRVYYHHLDISEGARHSTSALHAAAGGGVSELRDRLQLYNTMARAKEQFKTRPEQPERFVRVTFSFMLGRHTGISDKDQTWIHQSCTAETFSTRGYILSPLSHQPGLTNSL